MTPGQHSHKCGYVNYEFDPHAGCGHEWAHDNLCIFLPAAQFARAHRCPNCGRGPWVEKLESKGATTLEGLLSLLNKLEGK